MTCIWLGSAFKYAEPIHSPALLMRSSRLRGVFGAGMKRGFIGATCAATIQGQSLTYRDRHSHVLDPSFRSYRGWEQWRVSLFGILPPAPPADGPEGESIEPKTARVQVSSSHCGHTLLAARCVHGRPHHAGCFALVSICTQLLPVPFHQPTTCSTESQSLGCTCFAHLVVSDLLLAIFGCATDSVLATLGSLKSDCERLGRDERAALGSVREHGQ